MLPVEQSDETRFAVQAAELQDAATILAIQKDAYQAEACLYGDWSIPPLRQTLASLQAEFATHTILKALIGERIVGSVRSLTKNGECAIGRLIVDPSCQGRGIGSALLCAAEANAAGAGKFSLFTGSKSEANIRLYQRHGYSVVRTQALSPAVTLVYLEKRLAAQDTPT
ncbi:MAG: GNAT family N-acetyltransferase [Betaproteobacteria bacterium]|nr:GNAT family N-acetyltransferase [Betaproteobacteria bacterium]MCL2887093.1 GNAT family N-acetyltransferase [Betaproteobacteria bacterium]